MSKHVYFVKGNCTLHEMPTENSTKTSSSTYDFQTTVESQPLKLFMTLRQNISKEVPNMYVRDLNINQIIKLD